MKFKKLSFKIYVGVAGFLALIWFIIRVVPKPQRALYPCQKAAFPFASAFVIWVVASVASVKLFAKVRSSLKNSKLITSFFILCSAVLLSVLSYLALPAISSFANNEKTSTIIASEEINKIKSDSYHPIVSIVRSAKENSSDITASDIQAMVQKAVNDAGGLSNLIHDGQVVVLKPNLVCTESYADNKTVPKGSNGMVTDYRVIQAVVNIVRNLNPNGKIYILEGSAIGNSLTNMTKMGWTEVTGIDSIFAIEENSGDWYEYNSPKLSSVSLPDSIALYPDNLKPNKSRAIYLNKIYYEADVLISLPVLKNHVYTGITGSVKNLGIGGTPGKIYGTGKSAAKPTQRYGIQHDNRTMLHKWIHDFYACRPADFAIMDGIQGSDNGPVGYGYSNWSQAQRNMRMILASKDPIALDAVESLIMGHDPQKVPHLVYLHNDDFGCADPARIEIIGEEVEKVRTNFKISDSGAATKFFKYKSLNYVVENVNYTNSNLSFSVADATDLARVDITIGENESKTSVFSNFKNIEIPLGSSSFSDSTAHIRFIDKYLNTFQCDIKSRAVLSATKLKSTKGLGLFPNPAGMSVNCIIDDDIQSTASIFIYSVDGKLELSIEKEISTGKHFTLNISTLKPGSKIMVIKIGDKKFKARFSKV